VRVELVEIAEIALSTSITTEVDTILRIRSQKSLVEKLTTQNSSSHHEASVSGGLNESGSVSDQNMRPMILITVEDSGNEYV
jgi:hypothetical protein